MHTLKDLHQSTLRDLEAFDSPRDPLLYITCLLVQLYQAIACRS